MLRENEFVGRLHQQDGSVSAERQVVSISRGLARGLIFPRDRVPDLCPPLQQSRRSIVPIPDSAAHIVTEAINTSSISDRQIPIVAIGAVQLSLRTLQQIEDATHRRARLL